ncbi:hypothetical protein AVEN_86877-1 [Araneus ventricosus]|uniref:Uncharacterized protein n=1 Tax=Araneus ventricosus TaxID=182803 RepID=A0A4Y2MJU2_ARAVE|nr:hypothetical protein AVEN_86877-1 [Araneus ventricosus]
MKQVKLHLCKLLVDIYSIIQELKHVDEVAEWLRRWTANPLGSARVGSNPILVERGRIPTLFGNSNEFQAKLDLKLSTTPHQVSSEFRIDDWFWHGAIQFARCGVKVNVYRREAKR